MSQKLLTGTCACHAVTYRSTAPAENLDFCYCQQDQRLSGAPFIAWFGVDRHQVTWSGPITTYTLSDIATRSCCAKCGSVLTIQYHCYPDKTHVAAGTIVRSDWEVPRHGMHSFVKYKPSWYEIPDDGVGRWEHFDPVFDEVFNKWDAGRKKA